MKKKRIFSLLVMLVLLCCTSFVSGASISSKDTATVGDKIAITVNFGYAVGSYKSISVTYNGGTIASEGLWVIDASSKQGITSKSYTFTPTKAGTYTINFTATDVVGMDDTKKGTITATKTITVKEKAVTPSNNPSNSGSSGGSSSSSNSSTTQKSSNSYLKTLQVNHEGLTPKFSRTKTSYALTVNENVTSINVTAVAEDSKAKVSVSGNTNLKNGDNTISIVVTAENGNKRTYKIVVTKTNDADAANAYLENLIIENANFTPTFEAQTLEYVCEKVAHNIDKLTIKAFPQIEEAKVEIIGNDALVDGENIIKIIITAKDGTTKREYVVKVEREAETNGALTTSSENNSSDDPSETEKLANKAGFMGTMKTWFNTVVEAIQSNPLVFILYGFILIEFIEILYLYMRLYKKEKVKEPVDNRTLDEKLVPKSMPVTSTDNNISARRGSLADSIPAVNANKINDISINKPSSSIVDENKTTNIDNDIRKSAKLTEDEPVIVKSVDFNTSYDPTSFESRIKRAPDASNDNSYNEYIRSKNKQNDDINLDDDDNLNI